MSKPLAEYYVRNVNQWPAIAQTLAGTQRVGVRLRMDEVKNERTYQQNRAMHLWFTRIAEAWEAAGVPFKIIAGEKVVDLPITPECVKYNLIHPIIKAMFNLDSTAKLTRDQVSELEQAVTDRVLIKNGLDVPFPSNFSWGQ